MSGEIVLRANGGLEEAARTKTNFSETFDTFGLKLKIFYFSFFPVALFDVVRICYCTDP